VLSDIAIVHAAAGVELGQMNRICMADGTDFGPEYRAKKRKKTPYVIWAR
jgi:hypothetical protein